MKEYNVFWSLSITRGDDPTEVIEQFTVTESDLFGMIRSLLAHPKTVEITITIKK